MEFWKSHGTGNDFVVLPDLDDRLELSAPLVASLCDRRFGIGADGVLRIGPGTGGADVFMDYRNADGGVVEMCGNGVRVVAKHVLDHGCVTPDDDTVVVGTRSGDKAVVVQRDADGRVARAEVDMGLPDFDPAAVPFDAPDWRDVVDLDGERIDVAAVSMGNPHAVLLVDDVATAPVGRIGPALERHERFPKKVNVEFLHVTADDRLELRVWERGVGETASCGTGVCAAFVVAHRMGRVGGAAEVHVPGGVLGVRYRPDVHPSVFLAGPAVEVAHGVLDPAWLEAARAGRIRGEAGP